MGFFLWFILFAMSAYFLSKMTANKTVIYGAGFLVSLVIFAWALHLKSANKEELALRESQKENARVSQERYDRAMKKIAEQQKETEKKMKEMEDVKCRADLQCWGDKNAGAASRKCRELVEKHAKYQFEWTDGALESKFPLFAWKDESRRTLSYFGDRIKFQNGFGAWQFMKYQCDYDPATETVLGVSVAPGRM